MPKRAPKRFKAQPQDEAESDPASSAGPSRLPTPRLFHPFRALGFVCDHVPISIFTHSAKGALSTPHVNIVTSVGRSWMMWEAGRMGLVFVGPDAGETIRSVLQTGTEVYVTAGKRVIKYFRGKEVGEFKAPSSSSETGDLGTMILLGEEILVLKEDGTGLLIWNTKTGELVNQISFQKDFIATTILHPATYLNKVVIGGTNGELQLWNTRTCELIHTFPHPVSSTPSGITCLVQSPAIDVIGVGYLDGTLHVFDIKQGELVMQMKMEDGSVSSLSFRTGESPLASYGQPILASGASNGSIATWDLSKGGKLLHVNREAHEQGVTGLEFVPGQPLVISSSGDNSVKQWLFDSPEAVPRLLKFRGGHHAPPSLIRYYGEDGKQILTAGRDRALRYTSVVRDSRSHELSQGSFYKRAINLGVSVSSLKAPQITSLSSSSAQSKYWDDVLTSHADESAGRTWRVQAKRMGSHTLEVEEGAVQAVCVTACGNFGLAGSSTGEIRMWNMQSGKERRTFSLNGPAPGDSKPKIIATSKGKGLGKGKGSKKLAVEKSIQAITGLATDTLNNVVVASTLEGKVYFFDFHSTQMLAQVQLDSSITAMDLHRDSGLLSVTCDDLVVRLVDIETRRVVRELRGFKGRILDVAFSPDSRWLIATSLDSTIRTFDIPTGRLVDAFRTSSIATSLTFSPTGDFLATAHIDSLGVHLWANRAQFADVYLRHINEDDEVPEIGVPTVQGVQDDIEVEELEQIGAPDTTDVFITPEQLSEGLLTLSLMPRSRWQTLLNLDTIRQRNKPKEAPKAAERAPFFLPTVSGLETRFDLPSAKESADSASKRLAPMSSFLESDFTRRLGNERQDGDYNTFFEYLKSLSPSSLDLEIRSLSSLEHLSLFLTCLIGRLRSHRDFEAVQAVMSVFLTVHGDVLISNEELGKQLQELREAQRKESGRLSELVGYAMGTLGFLKTFG